jgi:hypothetical protein
MIRVSRESKIENLYAAIVIKTDVVLGLDVSIDNMIWVQKLHALRNTKGCVADSCLLVSAPLALASEQEGSVSSFLSQQSTKLHNETLLQQLQHSTLTCLYPSTLVCLYPSFHVVLYL